MGANSINNKKHILLFCREKDKESEDMKKSLNILESRNIDYEIATNKNEAIKKLSLQKFEYQLIYVFNYFGPKGYIPKEELSKLKVVIYYIDDYNFFFQGFLIYFHLKNLKVV